jgi:GNAT superfamily N-acetyltransferase
VTVTVRRATPADRAMVLALITAAHEDQLPEQVRAGQGFLQGRWDQAKLAALEDGPGIFLAEEDGELAGVAVTSHVGEADLDEGPPRLTIQAAASSAAAAGSTGPILLYGPVVVAPRFRGQGLVRLLLAEIGRQLGGRFPSAALFVEQTNHTSMAVHRRLGMQEHAEFTYVGRSYTVFVFQPGTYATTGDAAHRRPG